MSGFKVGDEVFVVQRHRVGVVEKLDQSPVRGLIYWVRFGDDLFFFTEGELGLKADLDKNNQLLTVKDIRDLLLSDEFIDALVERMNEKLFVTEVRSVTFGTVDISNADNNSGVAKCQIQ